MHSVQNLPRTPSLVEIVAEPPGLRWSWKEITADGQLAFDASVDLAGNVLAEANKAAFCRAACFFLAAKLDDTVILEAYEYLRDLYGWQIERARRTPKPIGAPITFALTNLNHVPRAPFVVDAGSL